MTALSSPTTPARPKDDASLRAVPWRRMAWVTWRQHRIALGGLAAFLGALAAWLWTAGLQLRHAYVAAAACHPAGSISCSDVVTRFSDMNHALLGGYVLQPVPALIGAFVGAPVLARELETGTFRYAWTQGFARRRWALAKLVALAVVVAAAAGALSVLISWYYQPYFATRNQALSLPEWSPLAPPLFDLRGVAFVAWALAAFAIGALAGMLIRWVVPAIVASLAAYTGLALAAGTFLRQHYIAPLVTTKLSVPGSALILSQWWTKDGKVTFGQQPPNNLLMQLCSSALGRGKPSSDSVLQQCLAQHGYTLWTRYQPASRFWPFQWIESGWLLALSMLLLAVTIWLVRRRAV